MIEIFVNDKKIEIKKSSTIKELIEQLGYSGKRFVVAYNLEFLPQNSYEQCKLKDGDKVEILEPMSGG